MILIQKQYKYCFQNDGHLGIWLNLLMFFMLRFTSNVASVFRYSMLIIWNTMIYTSRK